MYSLAQGILFKLKPPTDLSNTWKSLTKMVLCTCRWIVQPRSNESNMLQTVKLTCVCSAVLLHPETPLILSLLHTHTLAAHELPALLNRFWVLRNSVRGIISTYFLRRAESGSSAALYHRKIGQTCPTLHRISVHSQSAAKIDMLTVIYILNKRLYGWKKNQSILELILRLTEFLTLPFTLCADLCAEPSIFPSLPNYVSQPCEGWSPSTLGKWVISAENVCLITEPEAIRFTCRV